MKGVILAGGKGERLLPITNWLAKSLIPIYNKPMIQYAIEALKDAGIKNIGVVVQRNKFGWQVREFLRDGKRFGVKITYIFQQEPRGIAHGINCAKKFVGNQKFIVYLADNLFENSVRGFVQSFKKDKEHDASILLVHVANPNRFGVAELDKNGKLIGLEEKPKYPKSDLALAGIYGLNRKFFNIYKKLTPSWRGEYEITELIDMMVKDENIKVKAEVIIGDWVDAGMFDSLYDAWMLSRRLLW